MSAPDLAAIQAAHEFYDRWCDQATASNANAFMLTDAPELLDAADSLLALVARLETELGSC